MLSFSRVHVLDGMSHQKEKKMLLTAVVLVVTELDSCLMRLLETAGLGTRNPTSLLRGEATTSNWMH